MKNPATTPEPTPVRASGEEVWPLVIDGFEEYLPDASRELRDSIEEDMRARDAMGREKYGTPLCVGNGRDAGVDAYQEALDLCAYTRQKYAETGLYVWRQMHRHAVELVAEIRYQLHLEAEGED